MLEDLKCGSLSETREVRVARLGTPGTYVYERRRALREEGQPLRHPLTYSEVTKLSTPRKHTTEGEEGR